MSRTVLVAMSGGVDSSLAAALLAREGWSVTGLFLHLTAPGGCGMPHHAQDAQRVADQIGIELLTARPDEAFARVADYFGNEYQAGRTPNPCILCNATVKFTTLLNVADRRGIDCVATGHYVRATRDEAGAAHLSRAAARDKDQSYALFALPRAWLDRLVLPIGELAGKSAVRQAAREMGLAVHDKPDSQEVCFIPDDDHVAWLRRHRPEAMTPGPIVNAAGNVLGEHDGYGQFTTGQRRGLRVAAGVPMYVTAIDPATATVTIGPREESLSTHLRAGRANWHVDPPTASFPATVQVRYNHRGTDAVVHPLGSDAFEVEFATPVHAITPGQAAVVYRGDRILGGGWIQP